MLAFDMDEVLFPFAESHTAWRHKSGIPTPYMRSPARYDFGWLSDSAEEDIAATTAFVEEDGTLDVEPLPGSVESIGSLSREHRIAVVTARYQTQAPGTLRWLDRWFPGMLDDIIFVQSARGVGVAKASVCEKLGAKVLVDDTPRNLAGLSQTRGVLFGDHPWQTGGAGMLRATTWQGLDLLLPKIL